MKRRKHKQFKKKYRRDLHFIKKKNSNKILIRDFFYRIWCLGNIIGNQQSSDIALITYSCILENEPIQSSFYKLKTENRKEANKGNANSYFISLLYYDKQLPILLCYILFVLNAVFDNISVKKFKDHLHWPRVYDSKYFERLREGCIHDLCIIMILVCDRFYLWYYLVIKLRGII